MVKHIPHGELKDGDLNWREGVLFRVSNVTHTVPVCRHKLATTWHKAETCDDCRHEAAGRQLVRFTGHVVNDASLRGTSYDGGRYGAWADVPATVEVAR